MEKGNHCRYFALIGAIGTVPISWPIHQQFETVEGIAKEHNYINMLSSKKVPNEIKSQVNALVDKLIHRSFANPNEMARETYDLYLKIA